MRYEQCLRNGYKDIAQNWRMIDIYMVNERYPDSHFLNPSDPLTFNFMRNGRLSPDLRTAEVVISRRTVVCTVKVGDRETISSATRCLE